MIGHSQEALLKFFGGLNKNKDEIVAAEGIGFISYSLEKNEEIIWGLNSCNLGKIIER